MLEKILVPIDGSELSEQILKHVRRFAKSREVTVRLVRVLDPLAVDDALLRGHDLIVEARAQLDRLVSALEADGIKASRTVLVGDAADRILTQAFDFAPSIVAMATHGRSGADRWVRGSVAERVLRRSIFPLFLSNPRALEEDSALRTILVPLDGSEMSATVLPLAHELARIEGSELVLLHVVEPRPAVYPMASLTETPKEAHALLDGYRKALPGVPVRTIVRKGSPAYAILSAARKEKVDLVAMTTHGRSGPSRWVYGSVAEHVLHQCRAPLLVLRTSGLSEGATSSSETTASETETAARAGRRIGTGSP